MLKVSVGNTRERVKGSRKVVRRGRGCALGVQSRLGERQARSSRGYQGFAVARSADTGLDSDVPLGEASEAPGESGAPVCAVA